jgi:YVTN family beta-propeller protein
LWRAKGSRPAGQRDRTFGLTRQPSGSATARKSFVERPHSTDRQDKGGAKLSPEQTSARPVPSDSTSSSTKNLPKSTLPNHSSTAAESAARPVVTKDASNLALAKAQLSSIDTSSTSAPQTNSTTSTTQVAPPSTVVSRLVSRLLTSLGAVPGAGTSPLAPAVNPTLWTVLAWTRREFEAGGELATGSLTNAPYRSTQTAAESAGTTFSALATPNLSAFAIPNTPPVVTAAPTVGVPDPVTGKVSGTLGVTDPDGDALSYVVSSGSAGGAVSFDGSGGYTYTPTQAARLAAGATTGVDTDGFTVSVSDGQAAVAVPVTVTVSPAQVVVGPTVVGVGRSPAGVAVVGDRAYVTNQGDASVSVVNTTTNAVVGIVAVGVVPTSAAANAAGTRVYVANQGSNTVSVIDTASNTTIATIAVGSKPWGLVVSPNGQRVYVTNSTASSVSVIDTTSNTVTATVGVGSYPTLVAVSPDGGRVYVANRLSNTVSVIDTATNTATTIAGISQPVGIAVAPNGQRLYVTDYDGGLTVVNTATNTVLTTPTGTRIPVGLQPVSVAVSPDSSLAYVANADDTVSVVDTRTATVVRTLSIDSAPETGFHFVALSADGTRLYVTDSADKALRVVAFGNLNHAPVVTAAPTVGVPDPVTGKVSGTLGVTDPDGDALSYTLTTAPKSGTVTVNSATGEFAYTPTQTARDIAAATLVEDGDNFAYTVSDGVGAVSVTIPVRIMPTPSQPSYTTIATGEHPTGVVVQGTSAYVLNRDDNTVSLIDTTTNTVIATSAAVATQPTGLAVASDRSKIYLTNTSSNSVTVLDGTTLAQLGSLTVGDNPTDIVVSPDNTRLYVAHGIDGSISTVDTATGATLGSVTPAGTFAVPSALAINATGTRLYVLNQTGSVSVIDTATNTVVGQPIAVGASPQDIAISPDGKRVYVANGGANTVSVIDTDSARMIATVTAMAPNDQRPGPYALAVSPDGKFVYIAGNDDTVWVMDTTINYVVDAINDDRPNGALTSIAVTADGSELLVPDADGTVQNVVRMIDLKIATPTARETVSHAATVTGVSGASTTTIANGVQAASLASPSGKLSLIGTDVDDLLSFGGYYGPHWKTAADGSVGTAPYITSSFGIDMVVTNSRYVEVGAYAIGPTPVQVYVDGQKLSDTATTLDWNQTGPNTIKIDFGAGNAGPHEVRILTAGGAGLGNVWTEAGGSVSAPTDDGQRLFVLGDSLTQGYLYNQGSEIGTWLPRFANLTEINDVWNGGIGGTSFNLSNGNYPNYKTRAATEAVPSDADVVIVGTPDNDILSGRTPEQIAADVSDVVTALEAMPNHPKIIVLGGPDPTAGQTNYQFSQVDAAVISAISGRAAYISAVGGPLVGFDGTVIEASTTPWFTSDNKAVYIGADNFHPNDVGHEYVAYRMEEAYDVLMASDGEPSGSV